MGGFEHNDYNDNKPVVIKIPSEPLQHGYEQQNEYQHYQPEEYHQQHEDQPPKHHNDYVSSHYNSYNELIPGFTKMPQHFNNESQ